VDDTGIRDCGWGVMGADAACMTYLPPSLPPSPPLIPPPPSSPSSTLHSGGRQSLLIVPRRADVSHALRATSSGVSHSLRGPSCAYLRTPRTSTESRQRPPAPYKEAPASEIHAGGGCSPHQPERSTGAAPLGGRRQRDDTNAPSVRCGRLNPKRHVRARGCTSHNV
jgi:hypothetical protein